MADPLDRISDATYRSALDRARALMGTVKSSRTLQETVPGFQTQKGIYKPTGSKYALWIRQTMRGIYPDREPSYYPDGSWSYRYAPEAKDGRTDMTLSTNRSLLNCMEDRIPVGVFIQRSIAGLPRSYEVLGLAYVEKFDGTYFVMRGEAIDTDSEPMESGSIAPFRPFETRPPRMSESIRILREQAFKVAVRRTYHGKCSLCELGYSFQGQPIGVEAAHLIPVEDGGTSKDIRNGVLLCRNHHSLFDSYLWAFDEDFRVTVTDDRIFRESAANNCVLKVEGRRLPNLPEKEYDMPAGEAIRFRLDRFHGGG